MSKQKEVPIWFFIGALFTLYGLIILGSAIFGLLHPPPPAERVRLWNLHADVWWSALMVVFGIVYTIRFWPKAGESLTGKN
jgi:membrane protease YdiL (CAAX protease family)